MALPILRGTTRKATEVGVILGHDRATISSPPLQDLRIRQTEESRHPIDRFRVYAPFDERRRDASGVHRVEQEPHRAMRSRPAS